MAKKLSLGCKTIDELLRGGLPVGQPSLIYSMPKLGKSWFTFQAAAMCTRDPKVGGLGQKALILDTESFYMGETMDAFREYFGKRWPDANIDDIEFIHVPEIYELGRLFGFEITFLQSDRRVEAIIKYPKKTVGEDGVKDTTQAANWMEKSPIWKQIGDKKYGFLAIDSITMPIKDKIPMMQQNFPTRANVMRPFLASMRALALNLDMATFITDHTVKPPTMDFYQPWGGDDVTYYIKHQIGLFQGLKDQKETYTERVRRIATARWGLQDTQLKLVLLALNTGYTDLEDQRRGPA